MSAVFLTGHVNFILPYSAMGQTGSLYLEHPTVYRLVGTYLLDLLPSVRTTFSIHQPRHL